MWKVIFQPEQFTDQMLFSHTRKAARTTSERGRGRPGFEFWFFRVCFVFVVLFCFDERAAMLQVKACYTKQFGGDPSPPLPELCCRCRALLPLLCCDAPVTFVPEGKQDSCRHRALQSTSDTSSARVFPVHDYNLPTPSPVPLPPPSSLHGYWICHIPL